jgi:hypothetical protein
MEAATKAIDEGESLLVHDVTVTMYRSNGFYYGKLYLDRKFCKKRCIKLFSNSKEGEQETSDFLCIRYNIGQVSSSASHDVLPISSFTQFLGGTQRLRFPNCYRTCPAAVTKCSAPIISGSAALLNWQAIFSTKIYLHAIVLENWCKCLHLLSLVTENVGSNLVF